MFMVEKDKERGEKDADGVISGGCVSFLHSSCLILHHSLLVTEPRQALHVKRAEAASALLAAGP